ncbi:MULTISPECIES: phosphatidate cytidylyltransferase [Caproicibacterium]|uniref:Phosphatidate cytidylyltransferase n=1 Tax=Caproicibacterium argilliputei TaxID=3030016 RepID=A0AA97H391_9FIRM|nr:phosphatidate cytidylyltransferase [Caproicibacterium argilliputei]WOC33585.1 phosphatidate cytidylyltransferase [Caproicibacterium argilliputei]
MKVLNSIKQRLISALAILILMAAVVLCNARFPLALNFVIAVISVMAVWEISAALQLTRQIALVVPSMVLAAVLPFLSGLFGQGFVLFVYTVVLFSAMILYHSVITFREVAIIYSMTMLIPTALQSLVLLRELGGTHGMFHVIVAIFAAWVADAGAYIFGSLFGKHKLCPSISPKKTVEGAIGGVIVDVLIMLLFGVIFQDIYWNRTVHVNYFILGAIGFFGALLSMLGDLSFSIIKRSCHIKDFSELIPGHGGILDRFDSVIFVAPFVCLLLKMVPMVYE